MKIGITGASGNLGINVLHLLIQKDVSIKCLITGSRRSKKAIRKFKKEVEIIEGDVRDCQVLKDFIKDLDILLHFAAIVPPRFNYEKLSFTREVNVKSIKLLIKAIKEVNPDVKLLYPSSVAVWGDVRDKGECLLTLDDEPDPNADDIYAQQKVLAEDIIRDPDITYSIFRFGFMPNINQLKFDPMMFDVPLDTNMEVLHVKDAALAIVNALDKKEIWNKTLLIAGGEDCQITYKEFISEMLKTMGVGSLPEEVFGDRDFHCGFMDTDYSQKLLHYQKHSFEDIINEVKKKTRFLRFFATLFRPIAKIFLKSKSPYYKENKKKSK